MEVNPEVKTYRVKRQSEGLRLDSFVHLSLEGDYPGRFSRGAISMMLADGNVTHNGERIHKPHQKVHLHDLITCGVPAIAPVRPSRVRTRDTPRVPTVLYEDAEVLFVDKPAGLLTHPVQSGDASLIDWLLRVYPEIASVGQDPLRPGIVHRLDKDTSGILVIAKTPAASIELKRLFQEREVVKTYFALVEGHVSQSSGRITFPITRIPHSEKRSIRRATDGGEAREALTDYRVLTRYQEADLVEVKPKTGRTHQIRIHFSALQHPIVGDKLYGFRRKVSLLVAPRQMLHAGKLTLTLFGKMYEIEAELPRDFVELLGSLTVAE